MNFDEYRPLALRTAKMFPTPIENFKHAAIGMLTESGEFATEVKRHVIYGKPIDEQMRAHMAEELGDALWYIALAFKSIEADPATLESNSIEQIAVACDSLFNATLSLAATMSGTSAIVANPLYDFDSERHFIISTLTWAIAVIDRIAVMIEVPIEQIRSYNIAKLRARFPDKYSDHAAEARADKGGLDARIS